jgi:acyl-CoA synthetase (NDP forming)
LAQEAGPIGIDADVAQGAEILRKAGYPNYPFPEDAVRALAAMSTLVELWEVPARETPVFDDIDVQKARSLALDFLGQANEHYLGQADSQKILECYRLPLLHNEVAKTAQEASRIVEKMGKPVAMKIVSPDVVHKWDVGGVLLKITGGKAAAEAYRQILENVKVAVPNAKVNGILIEEMAKKGVEVILGANRDPRFGPLMMFGLGGTLVEVLKDVSFRLAPMWKSSAGRMIRQIRAFKVLTGVRGNPPSDVASIEDALLRLSCLVCDLPEVSELDINPLIVHAEGEGCSVADSRIMLRRPKDI